MTVRQAPHNAFRETLEVKSGHEISGIDFVFGLKPPTQTYKVRGRVLNSLTEFPDANITVLLFPRGDRDLNFAADQKKAALDERTGNFEIEGVAPGEYVATAISFAGAKSRIATQNVDVVATDIDSISLVLTRGIDIPVRITMEGKSAGSVADIRVFLCPCRIRVFLLVWSEARRDSPTVPLF